MLTFASPSVAPSVAAWIGSLAAPFTTLFSTTTVHLARQPAVVSTMGAHQAAVGDQFVDQASPCLSRSEDAASGVTYWPCERLNAFILQMAAHGHCVSAAMMLGHRPYAVQQLAAAQQVPDEALRSLAAELQAYFNVPPDTAVQPLAAA